MDKKLHILFFLIIEATTCLFAQQRFNFNFNSSQPDLLIAEAGDELQITGSEITLGGSPSALGGLAPYSFQWLPEDNLSDPTLPNPICNVTSFAEYVLTVTDSRGCVSSDSVQLLITSAEELKSPYYSPLFFPNPSQGQISIVAPKTFNFSLTTIVIFDQTGKVVISQPWEGSFESMGLDISKLSSGKYIIQVQDPLNSVSSPLIIK